MTTMTTLQPLPLLSSSPMPFSDAIKKAKVVDAATALAKKVRDEGGQQAQVTALQPSKTQHAVPQRDNEKGTDKKNLSFVSDFFHLELIYVYCYSYWFCRFLLSVPTCFGLIVS
jgi:hypothetical protein